MKKQEPSKSILLKEVVITAKKPKKTINEKLSAIDSNKRLNRIADK